MRTMRRVLVWLVVLGVLLVVADRVAAWAAQRAVAEHVATELAGYQVDSQPPEVTVRGVPFLTQVADGRFESVTLRLRDVGTSEVALPLVELTASGVTAAPSTLIQQDGPIDAERVDGSATIGYASVTALTDLPELDLSAGEDGSVRVRLPAELLGEPVTVVGGAEVSVTGGVVQLRVTDLTVEGFGELPPQAEPLVSDLTRRLSVQVPLPPLPYGLTVESVRAERAGLAVAVHAFGVPLAR
jgi:hypothetical protein